MSNLIKYYNFNVTEDDKRLLENDEKVGSFIPGIFATGQVEVRDLEREEFDQEFPEEMFDKEEPEEDLNSQEILQQAHEQAGAILEDAQKQAEAMLEQAKVKAEFEKEQIHEQARKSGYKDGLVQANDELASQREDLEKRREELEEQYETMFKELEPNFVRLVMDLVKKMTGVLMEERQGIVIYLMEKALHGLGKTSSLVVRVSEEDIELVRGREEDIRKMIDGACELDIQMDPSMVQNQCIIEADKQIIDCSLDVQLQGLLEDLKMLI